MQASHHLLFIMLEDKSIVEMQCSESLIDISVRFFQNILAICGLKQTDIVGPGRLCCRGSMYKCPCTKQKANGPTEFS